jgi:hypothetical protein
MIGYGMLFIDYVYYLWSWYGRYFFGDSHWPLRITMFYQGSPTIVTMFFIYHLTYVGSCHDWSMPLTLMNLSVIWSGSGAPAVYGNSDVPNALWPNVQVPHLWFWLRWPFPPFPMSAVQ